MHGAAVTRRRSDDGTMRAMPRWTRDHRRRRVLNAWDNGERDLAELTRVARVREQAAVRGWLEDAGHDLEQHTPST